jgi:F-type H+-transporting ATPase subunit delta
MVRGKETARRLARLLLRKIPKRREELLAVGEFLGFMAQLYRKERDFRNFFLSPFVPADSKDQLLKTLMERFRVPREALEVFRYMVETHAFSLLPDMKKAYDHEVERMMRMSKGYLFLAEDVDSEAVDRIKETIRRLLNRDLDIEVRYDRDLIGGFLFKTSGFVVDASVRRHLDRLLIGG